MMESPGDFSEIKTRIQSESFVTHETETDPCGTKKWQCELCSQTYKHKATLVRHMETHVGDTLKCNLCDYSTSVKNNLKFHIKTLHSDRKYSCPHCEQSFAIISRLDKHVRRHDEKKSDKTVPLTSCDICHKTFRCQSSLKGHAKKHAKTRFNCNACDFSAFAKNELDKHNRTHEKNVVASFACKICFKSYHFLSGLIRHEKSHEINPKSSNNNNDNENCELSQQRAEFSLWKSPISVSTMSQSF